MKCYVIGIMFLLGISGLPVHGQSAMVPTKDHMGWSFNTAGLGAGSVRLDLYDGKTHEAIALQADADVIRAKGVEIRQKIESVGGLTVWNIQIKNTSNQQRWFEPGVTLKLADGPQDASVWLGGGEQTHKNWSQLTESLQDDSARGRMPIMTVDHANQGVMIGLHPSDLFSYDAAQVLSKKGNDPALRYAIRTVLEPGSQATVQFVLGLFDANFGGFIGGLQAYYDSFPDHFKPRADVPESIWGSSSHYWMHRVQMDMTAEKIRRVGATWEWVYAPFKRSGDDWGHPELWNYKVYNPKANPKTDGRIFAASPVNMMTISRKDFFKHRKAYFDQWGPLVGLYWHTGAGVWVEKQLAQQRYPDAWTKDPDYKCELTRWVKSYDREVKVLPWYTSVEPDLRENFKKIAEAYNISGIALDVARGGPRYRGPAIQKNLAVRAYDEQGVFIDQGVAVAKFIDYLHTLPVRHLPGRVLGVIGNPEAKHGCSFVTSIRFDASMYEGQPYHHYNEAIPVTRYTLGQKPLTWWKGWYYKKVVPDWESQNPKQFVKSMNKLVDYVLFQSFKWAALPTANYQWGIPRLIRIMPILQETIRAGWQARFPVAYAFDGVLYTARYGRGLQSRLFWGNPYEDDRSMSVQVHNRYLGEGSFVFANRIQQGTVLDNELADGVTTLVFQAVSRTPLIHQAVAVLANPQVHATATAKMKDSFAGRKVEIALTADQPIQSAMRLPCHEKMELMSLNVDGKSIAFDAIGQGYQTSVLSWSRTHQVVATYASTLFGLSEAQLSQFQFIDKQGVAKFDIQVVDAGDLNVQRLPERVQQFFGWYVSKALNKNFVDIKVVQTKKSSGLPYRLVLSLNPDKADGAKVTMPDDHTLLVQGNSFSSLNQALLALLAKLESRFPYDPTLTATWGSGSKTLDHFGLRGKYLPEHK